MKTGYDKPEVINSATSVPNLNNGKSPHNKRRGLSETPEIQRKSRKLFAARTRDVDKLDSDQKALRKRSLTAPRSSVDETESSRKSSVSVGSRKKEKDGVSVSGAGKQFAVTLLVSESDKTKIMDMLHKAKTVISRKVEKVMGKKPPQKDISNADALKTVLQNWVEEEETKGQLISKGHFVFFNSPKKRTKNFCPSRLRQKFEFSSWFFLGELETPKRDFEINWPLKSCKKHLTRIFL